jgi:aldehyde:ferredoxin oxidoreductase
MIGSNLLIDHAQDLAQANEVLNRYTIDTIDAGGVIAWAYESFENNILTQEDTDGLELTWGNSKALVALCGKIGRREGIGDLLAEGLRACVKAYPESKEFAVEAMGMAIPAHDPRAFFGQVITSIASTRGPCHLNALGEANELGVLVPEMGLDEVTDRFSNENKGKISSVFQDIGQLWNSLTFCLCYYFEGFGLEQQKDLLNYITAWDTTVEDLALTGERITCLQQLFNLKMGFNPKTENVMPERLEKPRPTGEAAGKVPDWRYILQDYWKFRGWDDNGRPTPAKLEELGIA